jgi:hypothetical protein
MYDPNLVQNNIMPDTLLLLLLLLLLHCCCCRHLAAAEGCYSVAAWLLEEAGAASNPVDRFKRTPLEVRSSIILFAACSSMNDWGRWAPILFEALQLILQHPTQSTGSSQGFFFQTVILLCVGSGV